MWQIVRKCGEWVRPTIEYVVADDYSTAIDLVASAMREGRSGFSDGWFDVAQVTETRSGYGRKLNSGLKIQFCGKLYRIYVTCFSNSGTAWFTAKGKRYSVDTY